MEKTSRFQQMTRPTQKTGERRGTGRTKAVKEGGRRTHSQRKDIKTGESVKREQEQNKP